MGYFHLEQINNKWYLLDPEGKPFFMRGINHYGDGTYLPLNLKERYGDAASWRRALKERHLEWGFNMLCPSIGPSEVDTEPIPPSRNTNGKTKAEGTVYRTDEWSAQDFAEMDMPFTPMIAYPKQYMAGPGLPDVFSREFREELDKRCRDFCGPLKDNPNLIGYHFCHNPPWHPHGDAFFSWVHQIVDKGNEAQRVWAALMKELYGTVDAWRGTYSIPLSSFDELEEFRFPLNGKISAVNMVRDKIEFMKRVCEEWYKVYSETIRKYDPNHLLLGDRNTVHLQPLSDWAVNIMRKYVDVISINVMGPMDTALKEMKPVTDHWNGPVHIADTGAGVYESWPKSAYMCRDIEEFEDVYSGYVRLGVEHPQVIGLGWCGYFETRSTRCGLVDSVTDEPDRMKTAVIAQWNEWVQSNYYF